MDASKEKIAAVQSPTRQTSRRSRTLIESLSLDDLIRQKNPLIKYLWFGIRL